MVHLFALCIAAFLRGLAAHGLSLPLEAMIAARLHLPPLACTAIAILIAVIIVETAVHLFLEHRDDEDE
jgi:hypothetical protein